MSNHLNSITHRALCAFREQRAKEGNALLAKADTVTNNDRKAAIVHNAMKAFEDSNAAHAELGCDFANPCDAWGSDIVALVLSKVTPAAKKFWDKQEANMECRSIARFHADAYGEG